MFGWINKTAKTQACMTVTTAAASARTTIVRQKLPIPPFRHAAVTSCVLKCTHKHIGSTSTHARIANHMETLYARRIGKSAHIHGTRMFHTTCSGRQTLTPMCPIFFVKVYKSARISIMSLEAFLFKLRKHHFRLVSFFVCSEQHPICAFCVLCLVRRRRIVNLCSTCDISRSYQCILVTKNCCPEQKICFKCIEWEPIFEFGLFYFEALINHHGEM